MAPTATRRCAACARALAAMPRSPASRTNLGLLRAHRGASGIRAGGIDTGFIGRHADVLLPVAAPAPDAALAAAVLRLRADQAPVPDAADPWSPWNAQTAWRLLGEGYQDILLRDGGTERSLRLHLPREGVARLEIEGRVLAIAGTVTDDGAVALRVDGAVLRARVLRKGDALTVILDGDNHELAVIDPLAGEVGVVAGGDRVVAPMPGLIVSVAAVPEQPVSRGDVLLVLEAMKVQMRLTAPSDGVVARVLCAAGDLVSDGAELVRLRVAGG